MWEVKHQCDVCLAIDSETIEVTEPWPYEWERGTEYFQGMFTCFKCESDRQPICEVLLATKMPGPTHLETPHARRLH